MIEAITVSNSKFDLLYKGVVLGGNNPTGFRVLHNMFDNVYAEGVDFGDVNINMSAYNAFYNVGYAIGSPSPVTPVISFANDTSVSINDLFQRTSADSYTFPRISIVSGGTTSGGTQLQLGRYARETGSTFSLANNVTSPATIVSINNDNVKAFSMNYTIQRSTAVRHGVLVVTSGTTAFSDDYTENATTGVTLSVYQSGTNTQIRYVSSNTGAVGILTYSISHLA